MSNFRLTCGTVQLRLVTPRSAPQLFALARDPELSRFLQWQPHASIEDSLSYIEDTKSLWERRIAYLPGIFDIEHERSIIGGKLFDIQITVVGTVLFVAYTAANAYLRLATTRGIAILRHVGLQSEVMGHLEYAVGSIAASARTAPASASSTTAAKVQ